MKYISKKIVITTSLILLQLLLSAAAFPDDASKPETPISARYTRLNSDGTETNCIVTGNETQEERKNLQKTGCTLETLRKDSDIEVEVTLQTNSGFKSILLTSKYYLMWLNSGLHAVNIIRNLPLAVTSLVSLHPIDSLGYLAYSALYNVGLSRNANQTLYPFLTSPLTFILMAKVNRMTTTKTKPMTAVMKLRKSVLVGTS